MRLPKFRETPLKRTKRRVFVRNIANEKFNLGADEVAAAQRRKRIEVIFVENSISFGGGDNSTPWIAEQVAEHGEAVVEAVSPEEWSKTIMGDHFF